PRSQFRRKRYRSANRRTASLSPSTASCRSVLSMVSISLSLIRLSSQLFAGTSIYFGDSESNLFNHFYSDKGQELQLSPKCHLRLPEKLLDTILCRRTHRLTRPNLRRPST